MPNAVNSGCTDRSVSDEPHPLDSLDRARIRAIYAVLAVIVLLALGGAFNVAHLDLGIFATLMGGLVSLLGLGAVIRLVGPK